MRVQVAIPEPHISAPVLDAALEGVTRLNEEMIKSGSAPPFSMRNPGVRWKPEPPGQEHFDHAGIVHGRGWGDCDDLAPWHAATLRVTGRDPGAHAIVRRSGPSRWHAIVRRSDGSIDDPSLAAGMPGRGRKVGVCGATVPIMFAHTPGVDGTYQARPQLALRPVTDRSGQIEAWQARADLPWHWQPGDSPGDIAMASLHASPVSDQAIVGAICGAIDLGEASGFADEDHLDRLEAIAAGCDGASWEEIAAEWGPEHADAAEQVVGGFFGGLRKRIRKAARSVRRNPLRAVTRAAMPFGTHRLMAKALPLASKVTPFLGPYGQAANMALKFAGPALQRSLANRRHVNPRRRTVSNQYTMRGPGGQNFRCVPF